MSITQPENLAAAPDHEWPAIEAHVVHAVATHPGVSGPGRPTSGPTAAVRGEWRRGGRDMVPFAVGYVPFGLLVGATAAQGSDPAAGWAGTWTIYGGSAHLAALNLVSAHATTATAIAAGVLVNLRLLAYATAVSPLWAGARWPWRLAAAGMLVDPVWLLAERRSGEPGGPILRRAHYLGAATTLAVAWMLSVTTGVALGSAPAATDHLAMAVPLCLTSMVVPHLRVPGGWAAVGAATAAALVTRSWPAGSGLLVAMAVAALAGLCTSRAEGRP